MGATQDPSDRTGFHVRRHRFRSFGVVTALGALGALTVLAGCSSSSSGHSAKQTSPANAPLTYTTLNLGLPQNALSAPVTGHVPANQMLHVNVTLKVSSAALDKLGKSAKSPSSGAQNLAKQLGVSDSDIAKIQQYFANGHIQAKPNKTHTNVTFDVSAGTAAKLLQTRFVTHKLKGRSYFTPDAAQPPKIPTQIAGYILAVTGLDSYSLPPKTGAMPMGPAAPQIRPAASGRCVNFYPKIASPAKIAKAYGYNQMWAKGWHGEGVTVNLVEIDGYNPSDVSTYVSCIGSKATLQNVNMGTVPAPGPEATLDIEMLSGLAPGVRMVDYQEDASQGASWSAFNEALQQVIDDNQGNSRPGSIVSISLGGPEDELSQNVMQSVDQNIRILTEAEHMTVFVASGDCAAFQDGQYGNHPNVGFPASSPSAVGVGGTRMSFSGSGTRTGESVWSDRSNLSKCQNSWGSNGGVSQVFPRPDYQQGSGVQNRYSNGNREVPDVSAAAIEIPVALGGQWVSMGGTSAAAPIWAAGMSLVNQGLMTTRRYFYFGPRTFYDIANAAGNNHPYYDVTHGNNLYYPATLGYDQATGLGTPEAPAIYNLLYNARQF